MTTSGVNRKYLLSPISHALRGNLPSPISYLLSPICLVLCALALHANAQAPGIRRLPARPGLPTRQAPSAEPAPAASDYDGPTYKAEDFEGTNAPALKFDNAPAEILLQTYAEVTGKTLLQAPNLPKATITLKSEQTELTKEEFLQAIETILVMNNIAIVPDGEKFLRVFPANELRTDGVKTHFNEPEGGAHVEDGKMVSQMITLKNISLDEAKKAIEGFKRKEGLIQTFERTNSILITDTVENVNRMMEILKFIDQPLVNRDEVNVRPLKFAKAADIKKRLEEIVAESQKEQQQNKQTSAPEARTSGAPGIVRRTVPGVVRPGMAAQPETPANNTIETLIDEADRGMIKGKVQIIADERTNLLIIITRPENMVFFNRIIDVLDVEVQTVPDVIVKVIRLEHTLAEEMAPLLNDLISNNDSKKKSETDAEATVADKNDDTGSRSLIEAADKTRQRNVVPKPEPETKGRVGELRKENIKILADKKTNAIIVMASPSDMQSILDIIASMDIQRSQVVIETVIVSVKFDDTRETGMDWIQKAMLTTTGKNKTPRFAYADAGGGGQYTPADATTLTRGGGTLASGGGITGWFSLFDLNMDVIMRAIKTDSRAQVMQSPRITTMDNEEGSFEDTQRIYWSEGSTHYTSSDYYSDNIKNEDVGIKLKVKPHIGNKGYAALEIEQEIQTSEGQQAITTRDSTTTFPNLVTRKMKAQVSVYSGETVVLGGLSRNTNEKTVSRVPILGSIPLLGWLFRYQKDVKSRTEIIVFLTPRVVNLPAAMEDDARKLKASMDTEGIWDSSWSSSRLADPLKPKQARKVLENGKDTVVPPRYPLTGYLTGLNDEKLVNVVPAISNAVEQTPPGEVPYVHFSDIDINSRIAPGSLRYEESVETVTNAPASGE
ncbi:MAG: type II secretion system secretin GspD [Kiritimatiellae bacterium]|nr:type II secretion system secretin GspD [Kiritimatiellia bacterium]